MTSNTQPVRHYQKPRVVGWFLVGGVLGLAVCLVVMFVGDLPAPLLYVLLPTIGLLFDPSDEAGIGVALYLFGGNFLIYGVAGVLVGFIVSFWQAWFGSHSENQ